MRRGSWPDWSTPGSFRGESGGGRQEVSGGLGGEWPGPEVCGAAART